MRSSKDKCSTVFIILSLGTCEGGRAVDGVGIYADVAFDSSVDHTNGTGIIDGKDFSHVVWEIGFVK